MVCEWFGSCEKGSRLYNRQWFLEFDSFESVECHCARRSQLGVKRCWPAHTHLRATCGSVECAGRGEEVLSRVAWSHEWRLVWLCTAEDSAVVLVVVPVVLVALTPTEHAAHTGVGRGRCLAGSVIHYVCVWYLLWLDNISCGG